MVSILRKWLHRSTPCNSDMASCWDSWELYFKFGGVSWLGQPGCLCADWFCSVKASSPSKHNPELYKPCSALIVFRLLSFLSCPLKPCFIFGLVFFWLHLVRNTMKSSVFRRRPVYSHMGFWGFMFLGGEATSPSFHVLLI